MKRTETVPEPTGGEGGHRRRDTDGSQLPSVPTGMRFMRDPITIKRGGNTTVWVEIDAKNGYLPDHEDDLTVSFDTGLGGKVTDVAKSHLLGGRSCGGSRPPRTRRSVSSRSRPSSSPRRA